MKKSILLLIVILALILPANPAFSQNVNPDDLQKYLKTHPEAKKYVSPEGKPTSEGEKLLETRQREGAITPAEIKEGMKKLKEKEKGQKENLTPEEAALLEEVKEEAGPGGLRVFGQQLFSAGPASFTPPSNMPVSTGYIIGPDDNIVVHLWGRINEQYTLTVQRDGSIQFPQIGALQVAGLTYKQLQDRIKREAEAITGVNVNVTMGKLRSITIFVVGSVKKPGAYTVSAFDTILNALMYSGGPEIVSPKETYEPPFSFSKESAEQPEKEKREKVEEIQKSIDLLKNIVEKKKFDEELRIGEELDIQRIEEQIRILEKKKFDEDYTSMQNLYDKKIQDKKEAVQSVLLGSMRNIELRRHNRLITTFDLYDLILKGDNSKDVRLEPGDIIFVPKAETVVAIEGDVKVPAIYELKKEKSLLNALKLAGDITPSAYSEQIQIQRYLENRERIVLDISLDELKKEKSPFTLQDGDVVRIFPVVEEDTNAVYLFGNITRPGKYEYNASGMRISDIVKTDELKPETYFPYALIKRYVPPEMSAELVPFKLGEALLKHNMKENIPLQPGDEIHIFNKWTFEDKPYVSVAGEVRRPELYPCDGGMRVKDAILAAGDLTKDAYLKKAEIIRVNEKKEYQTIYFDVAKALGNDPDANLLLRDQDRIVIHSIWEEVYEKNVYITGNVKNPGTYQYTKQMTVKDLVFKAGNILESAYVEEAEIASQITEDRKISTVERKTINLGKALEGDPADNVILKPYDILHVKRIPDWHETTYVSLSGEFRFPGKYTIKKGERLSSLIERAGGYTDEAYLRGAAFTRESVRTLQQASLDEMVKRMEREVMSQGSAQMATAVSKEEIEAKKVELEQKRKFIDSLYDLKATGRMTIRMAHARLLKGSDYDITLEDGDILTIPIKNNVVNVVGAVMSRGSYIYSDDLKYQDYIAMTGGYSEYADEDNTFVLKVDGSARKIKDSISWNPFKSRWEMTVFGEKVKEIEPGDTIIVPEEVSQLAWLREIKDITQVLMQMAVTAAVTIKMF